MNLVEVTQSFVPQYDFKHGAARMSKRGSRDTGFCKLDIIRTPHSERHPYPRIELNICSLPCFRCPDFPVSSSPSREDLEEVGFQLVFIDPTSAPYSNPNPEPLKLKLPPNNLHTASEQLKVCLGHPLAVENQSRV